MKLTGQDLEEYKIARCEAETLSQDRTAWRNLISHRMSAHAMLTVPDDDDII